jgi:glutamyl-tRNA synthetase
MTVITRFAPSPTGYLHIGGARTALFNYLFARHHKGKFLLRIEDTDKERSSKQATEAIFSGLKWLRLEWEGEVIFQSQRNDLYKEAALNLLKAGKAYYCYSSQEEIDNKRNEAMQQKQHFIFKSPWRDVNPNSYPKDIKPVIRLKSPREGQTIIHDTLQGDVIIDNAHIDDMILLRSDGTATYMLAVVVDDHDMGITHIIRGDDHLTNAARQILIYKAAGWEVPSMVHIPLIHGMDGAKLSKRHGALGIDAYKAMGYLPDALCNYLLRLGWSHKDDEIIGRAQAIEWFDIDGLGKSAARLDFTRMKSLNAEYLRKLGDDLLTEMVVDILKKDYAITEEVTAHIKQGMEGLKIRASLVTELAGLAKVYLINHPVDYSDEALLLIKNCNKDLIGQVIIAIENASCMDKDSIQAAIKSVAERNNLKLAELMAPVRALMTGSTSSPSIFEIISIIGKDNTIKRLKAPF